MLPLELHKFFWEYEAHRIDPEKEWYQVIERLLEYGDLAAIKWAYHFYTKEQIAEVVRKSRNLSRKTATFWQNLLGLPREEVRCLNTSCQQNELPFSKN